MLIRNTFYNLMGLGLPLLVAVGSMPVLIARLGDSRFGLLTLIWAVVSYFGLFDLGLGRALTQQLSKLIAEKRDTEIPPLVFTSLVIMLVLGLIASMLMWMGAEPASKLVSYAGSKDEVVGSMQAMAWAMPFIIITSGLRGFLEAKLQFGIVNLIRFPMGIFTFLGPLAVVLFYKNDLVMITLVLTAGRIIACLAHAYFVFKDLPRLWRRDNYHPRLVRDLLVSGGWMTVSNIVSPLMGYLDRFLIGALITTAAVAYYVTPFELVSKLWIIPGALTPVLFTRFAGDLQADKPGLTNLFKHSITLLLVLIFPLTLFVSVFSSDILRLWIGSEFSEKSYLVMQIFSIGILINCMAHIPFTLIQGMGRSRTTAIIHIVELPLFALLLWVLILHFGVKGAAIAWLIRISGDAVAMFLQAGKIIDFSTLQTSALKITMLALLIAISFVATLEANSFILKAVIYLLAVFSIYFYCWQCLFSKNEQRFVFDRAAKALGYLKK